MIKRQKVKWIFFLFLIALVVISAVNYSVTVYSIGDSTMCNFSLSDATHRHGWMQNIGPFFSSEVKIVNAAKSGRSSKSFIDEGLWDGVISKVVPGDYVIIQFGHNDEKDDTLRHTDPWTTYTDNMRRFVNETRQKGGIPILCTSIVRRYYNYDGTIKYSHGDYPDAVRKLAADSSVFLVDMEELTKEFLENVGEDSSLSLFASGDNTHLNDTGATAVGGLFVDHLKRQSHPLVEYVTSTEISDREIVSIPENIQLLGNYPNPFNPETKIDFIVNKKSQIRLEVFNILGKKVQTLVNENKSQGRYSVTFNANDLSSGIYLYRLSSPGEVLIGKMVLMK